MTDEFFDAYVEALLWSTVIEQDGHFLPAEDLPEDPALRDELRADAEGFHAANADIWRKAGWADDEAGYDFALTRNGHGTGFWDRGRGTAGDTLAAAARVYGEVWLYLTDDGEMMIA